MSRIINGLQKMLNIVIQSTDIKVHSIQYVFHLCLLLSKNEVFFA
jgi:hypothetical protein